MVGSTEGPESSGAIGATLWVFGRTAAGSGGFKGDGVAWGSSVMDSTGSALRPGVRASPHVEQNLAPKVRSPPQREHRMALSPLVQGLGGRRRSGEVPWTPWPGRRMLFSCQMFVLPRVRPVPTSGDTASMPFCYIPARMIVRGDRADPGEAVRVKGLDSCERISRKRADRHASGLVSDANWRDALLGWGAVD